MSGFSADVYQNEFLPRGGAEVNAIVTVTSNGAVNSGGAAAEIVIVDVSGSMQGRKLRAAKEATIAAVDGIRDGVRFGVVAGREYGRVVFPAGGEVAGVSGGVVPASSGLVPASVESKEAAGRAVASLEADGGTAIGSWLSVAGHMFADAACPISHAILLTDGRNENESSKSLAATLEACRGHFQCDCRGVGTDWEVEELRRIATTLLGTVDIVAEPSQLEADFRAMTERAMGKAVPDVVLRLWTPRGAEVAFVKQVSPTVDDLTARAVPHDPLTVDYPTGAWGAETRDYHVCIKVPPREVGDEMLAGRISLAVSDEVVRQALVRAVWTDDERLSTRINGEVAHYTGQAELAQAIQQGLEARKAGDDAVATIKLGEAVRLAEASGHDETLRLLERLVDVHDLASGTVRLKPRVDAADEMALDTRSTRSIRARENPE